MHKALSVIESADAIEAILSYAAGAWILGADDFKLWPILQLSLTYRF